MPGYAKTYVENVNATAAINAQTKAHHDFLKMRQPIDESTYPQPRIAEGGRTYKFPFTFVIPDKLLPAACSHKCDSEQIHQAHLQLPPTLGDPGATEDGQKVPDDLAPRMVRVSYGVRVKVIQHRDRDGKDVTLADKVRKLRLIPRVDEDPPVDFEHHKELVPRKEERLRKGLFKGRLGTVTLETTQPKSLRLAPPRSVVEHAPTTMTTLVLRFDPTSEHDAPPRLGMLTGKLKVSTFFGSHPMRDVPCRETAILDSKRGSFFETISLPSRSVESARWERHDASDEHFRRDSVTSISAHALPAPSSTYVGKPFYTARVVVPITLSKNKTLVPTFSTCLISRSYRLELELKVHTRSRSFSTYSMQLRVPLQVSSEGNSSGETEDQEVCSFFHPRVTRPVSLAMHCEPSDNPNPPMSPASGAMQVNDTGQSAAPSATPNQAVMSLPPGYSPLTGASK